MGLPLAAFAVALGTALAGYGLGRWSSRRRVPVDPAVVEADLADLARQVDDGEIDAATAAELRARYETELAVDPRDPEPAPPGRTGRSRAGIIAGTAVLVVAIGGIAFAVGRFIKPAPAQTAGLAATTGTSIDLNSVSNETMEAVIAANLDNPQINGMRMALARRYFEQGNYQKAFAQYEAVLNNNPPPAMAASALTNLGWMVYTGNQDPQLAMTLFDRALELVPDDPLTLYLKGEVAWCGLGDAQAAASLFSKALASPSLTDSQARTNLETQLAAAQSGQGCPTG